MSSPASAVYLIGYSGHAWVVAECLLSGGYQLGGYCERQPAPRNPFALPFLGHETDEQVLTTLATGEWFVAVGDNTLRRRLQTQLAEKLAAGPAIARHASAVVSPLASLGPGAMVGPLAVINAGAHVGAGAICNSNATIEHECLIGDFAHIAPGAVLAGNVTVGREAFVGVGAAVKQGVTIGERAIVGAGAVIVKDVAPDTVVVGNPQRLLR